MTFFRMDPRLCGDEETSATLLKFWGGGLKPALQILRSRLRRDAYPELPLQGCDFL